MPSGRHARPDRRPKPSTVALAAATATAIAVTPAVAAGASTTSAVKGASTKSAANTAKASKTKASKAKTSTAKAATAVSARARKAVAYALAHRHDQYRYGGTGPHRFDCSGLTLAAWRQAGVKLPHRAKQQARRGKHVPKSRLKPGDLVFFYTAKSHVGMYIGGGKFIHAANPRADIKIDTLAHGYYSKKFVAATHIG